MWYSNSPNRFSIRTKKGWFAPAFSVYLQYDYTENKGAEAIRKITNAYIDKCIRYEHPNGLLTIPYELVESVHPALNTVLAIHANDTQDVLLEAAKRALLPIEEKPPADLPFDFI